VIGIATDDVRTVEITMADGTVRSVEVTNNLLDFSSAAAPREVQWNGPTGPERFTVLSIVRG
jgi:hypothetical protein